MTLDSADRIGDVSAYLNLRLTGQWASSRASADCTGMMDMVLGTWSRELCTTVGVPIDKLPPRIVDPPGAAIGLVTDEVAAELGLPAGLPVIAAAGDGQCAAVGAGVIAPGSVYLNMGTAEVCGTISEDYVWDRDYRTVVAASGNGYLLEAFLSSGTYLINWFLDSFGSGTPASEQIADLEAALTDIGPGAEGGLLALPYWHGAQTPYWDSAARGGAVIGWTGTHTKAHFYRAILEGVAFEVKLQVEGLTRAVADKPTELLVTGGGSRSPPIWHRLSPTSSAESSSCARRRRRQRWAPPCSLQWPWESMPTCLQLRPPCPDEVTPYVRIQPPKQNTRSCGRFTRTSTKPSHRCTRHWTRSPADRKTQSPKPETSQACPQEAFTSHACSHPEGKTCPFPLPPKRRTLSGSAWASPPNPP